MLTKLGYNATMWYNKLLECNLKSWHWWWCHVMILHTNVGKCMYLLLIFCPPCGLNKHSEHSTVKITGNYSLHLSVSVHYAINNTIVLVTTLLFFKCNNKHNKNLPALLPRTLTYSLDFYWIWDLKLQFPISLFADGVTQEPTNNSS